MVRAFDPVAQLGGSSDERAKSGAGPRAKRHREHTSVRGSQGRVRVVARHCVRVVRFLSLRIAGGDHLQAVFLGGQSDRSLHLRADGVRRGLRGAAVRRAGVRAARRPGRAQAHLPHHHHHHGPLDLRRRPAAELCIDRHRGPDHPDRRCDCCKAWRSAASMAAPRPMSRSMPSTASAACTPAGSRPPRPWACSCRC